MIVLSTVILTVIYMIHKNYYIIIIQISVVDGVMASLHTIKFMTTRSNIFKSLPIILNTIIKLLSDCIYKLPIIVSLFYYNHLAMTDSICTDAQLDFFSLTLQNHRPRPAWGLRLRSCMF